MDTLLDLKVFILLIIDRHKSLKDQYSLTRFFAKSSVLPDKLNDTLNYLENDQLILTEQIKNTVRYYAITEIGKQYLVSNYSQENLTNYLKEIDETHFLLQILNKIDF